MKNFYRYILLLLVLVLVLAQPLSVSASTGGASEWPIYCQPENYPYGNLEEDILNYFLLIQSKGYYHDCRLSDMHVCVYVDPRFPDSIQFVYQAKERPLKLSVASPTLSFSTNYKIVCVGNSSSASMVIVGTSNGSYVADAFFSSSNSDMYVSANSPIYYTNYDICATGLDIVCITSDKSDDTDDDYIFEWDEYIDNFEDFMEENEDANNEIQQEELVTEEEEPNVFLRVFQNIGTMFENATTLLQNTRDMLSAAIGEFFNNTIPHILQNAFNVVLPDEVMSIFHELYSSGLDSDGVFSLYTLFDYWLIPSDDFSDIQFERVKSALPFVGVIERIGLTMKNGLMHLEGKAPTFTILAGTYGFLEIKDSYTISFEWYEYFRPFAEPIFAIFLYVGFAFHLLKNLPGILGGTSAVTSSVASTGKDNSKGGK